MTETEFLKAAAHVVPSARQQAWYDTEFYAFVHFTVNTYTNLEWGLGTEDEQIFNPTELNCDEWVESVKAAGAKGLVLTCKHHDGFCLWPTKTTDHCVRRSPWKDGKGDVVREAAEACRRGGIKFGVYLSPWDRNASCYGTDAYNDFYCEQLTELLTGYGELFMVWFDGACGEGPNGRVQTYDYDRYIALIRKYQPNACVFNDHGPDVRWCGNEAGKGRPEEWAVVPSELCFRAEVQTGAGPLADPENPITVENADQKIGDREIILASRGLTFTGAEIDMSIRPGWFYHEKQKAHSLERLFRTYMISCGANAAFNLNVPPMPNGRFHPDDIRRLQELGDAIRSAFGEEKKIPAQVTAVDDKTYEIVLPSCEEIRYLELAEEICEGQRIEAFHVEKDGEILFSGTTVGHRKLCAVEFAADRFLLVVDSARDKEIFSKINVFRA